MHYKIKEKINRFSEHEESDFDLYIILIRYIWRLIFLLEKRETTSLTEYSRDFVSSGVIGWKNIVLSFYFNILRLKVWELLDNRKTQNGNLKSMDYTIFFTMWTLAHVRWVKLHDDFHSLGKLELYPRNVNC